MIKPLGKLSVYSFIPLFVTLLSLQTNVDASVVNVNRVAIRADLSSCLTGLNVTLPGSSAFQSESQTFNARLSYTPAAIVFPYVFSINFPRPFGAHQLTSFLEIRFKMFRHWFRAAQVLAYRWLPGRADIVTQVTVWVA
jgi:hypothetical protein